MYLLANVNMFIECLWVAHMLLVGVIASTIHPHTCFLRMQKITSNNAIESKLTIPSHHDRVQPECLPHARAAEHLTECQMC